MAITRLGGATAITGTIPQGNIANASLGAVTALPGAIATGKVLQVLTATDSTERTTTSASYVTGSNTLLINITPSSSSSKVFISSSFQFKTSNVGGATTWYTLYRGSTNLGADMSRIFIGGSSGQTAMWGQSLQILDSPNSTSQQTYQVYMKGDSGITSSLNNNSTKGTITAFEIAG